MKIRITDTELPGEELILEIQCDDPDEVIVTEHEAFKIIEFWESSTSVGDRGSYDLTDDGIIVLAEVHRTGDAVEMGAWYITDLDYELEGFPFSTLEFEEITEETGK